MLDNLIESRNHIHEHKTIGGFMLSTSVVILSVLTAGMIYSLFSQTVVLGSDNLEISTLVAPVSFAVKPEPVRDPETAKAENRPNTETKIPSRRMNIQRPEESPVEVPKTISVTPSGLKTRPNSDFVIAKDDVDPAPAGGGSGRAAGTGSAETGGIRKPPQSEQSAKIDLPPPVERPAPVKPVVSGGVVNGKALELVRPVYSPTAKGLGVKGEVRVQVLIDENGNVISASAVSGHPLLRSSAVSAARASKFSPTTLSDQAVKVAGFIVYNFS